MKPCFGQLHGYYSWQSIVGWQIGRILDEMKTYRNEQHGFEIDVPETWNLPKGDAIKTPFGESIAFGCDTNEDFNFQIGQSTPESLDQPEREFRRYAQVKQYSGLELGRIAVGDGNHIWALIIRDLEIGRRST